MEKMKLRYFILILGILGILNIGYTYGTSGEKTITIEKSEMVINSGGKGRKYLIFTKNGVFENTDSFFRFKFNSSDMYSLLKEDKTYNVKYYGWRIPLFSMYPNIYEATKQK